MTVRLWARTKYPSGWKKTNFRSLKIIIRQEVSLVKKPSALHQFGPILFGLFQGDFLFQSFQGGKQSVTVGIAALKPT